jgi:sugar lactone lactonase YvrE
MYFTHTTTQQVLAWDYDPATGEHSSERVFYQYDGPGSPDGFRVDVDGNIWHAVYGGACVLKISPEGKVVGKINLPTKNVTCPEFVGTELWITTAADDEGEEESKKYAGGLFKVDVGTTGLPHTDFRLAA